MRPSLLLTLFALSCSREVQVGDFTCPVLEQNEAGAPSLLPPESPTPLPTPWSSGFEDGFCGYYDGSGFCYLKGQASFRRVEAPVHSGRFAAAFDIDAISSRRAGESQARCVREGELPRAAYYGAWYFVPRGTLELTNWNLFHFEGGRPNGLHGLWDVSLRLDDGELFLYLFSSLTGDAYQQQEKPVPLPTDRWVHIEFYWDRQSDATGEVRLYQDGELIVNAEGIVTDDSEWGQWYVGNLALALRPSKSTVYVDDVSVRLSR